jgi:hypothetical protein
MIIDVGYLKQASKHHQVGVAVQALKPNLQQLLEHGIFPQAWDAARLFFEKGAEMGSNNLAVAANTVAARKPYGQGPLEFNSANVSGLEHVQKV